MEPLIEILKNNGFTVSYLTANSTIVQAIYNNLFLTISNGRLFSKFWLENSRSLPAKFPGFRDIIINPDKFDKDVKDIKDRYDRICKIYEDTLKLDEDIENNRERMIVLGLIDRSETNGLVNHAENLYHELSPVGEPVAPIIITTANKGIDKMFNKQVLAAFTTTAAKSKVSYKPKDEDKELPLEPHEKSNARKNPKNMTMREAYAHYAGKTKNDRAFHSAIIDWHKRKAKNHDDAANNAKNVDEALKHANRRDMHTDLHNAHVRLADHHYFHGTKNL